MLAMELSFSVPDQMFDWYFNKIGPGCSLLWQALDMSEKLNVAPPSSILLLDKFPPKHETFLPKTSKCTRFYDKFVTHALN